MVDRSVEAWKSWKDAQLKYDYYIVGLVAALFAYVGSSYIPQKIAFSQNTFELTSIIFLAVSLIVGIKRLEIDLQLQTITLKQCEASDLKKVANTIIAHGGSKNGDTGGEITVSEASEKAELLQSSLKKLNEIFIEKSKVGEWLFKIRNWALSLGFITYAASKIVGVYNI